MRGNGFQRQPYENVSKTALLMFLKSLERKTYTNTKGLTRTQTTSTLLYSFDSDSVVLGREMLLLQGQPQSLQIEGQKDSVLRSLAGEGMAVPCVGLVVWALMLTKQFPDGPDDAMILDKVG